MSTGYFQTTGFYSETPDNSQQEIDAVTALVHRLVPADQITGTLMALGIIPSPDKPAHVIKQQKKRSTGYSNTVTTPKTHCRRGHQLTPENVWIQGGYRRCKKCAYETQAIRKGVFRA